MRVCKPMWLCLILFFGVSARADEPLQIRALRLTAKADLNQVRMDWSIMADRAVSASPQIIVRRDDITTREQWDTITPTDVDGKPVVMAITSRESRNTLYATLPKGKYGACRLVLFAAENGQPNFSRFLFDSIKVSTPFDLRLDVTITSNKRRVVTPTLVRTTAADTTLAGDGTYTAMFDVVLRLPRTYAAEKGFWVMAKGAHGFAQEWVDVAASKPGSDAEDDYQTLTRTITIKGLKKGVHSWDLGLFRRDFGTPINWLSNGAEFDTGEDWVRKVDAARLPPRVRVTKGHWTMQGKPYNFYAKTPIARAAVPFVRGGNYGNAVARSATPLLNTSEYFTKLRGVGCRFVRFNYNPDRYLEETMYRRVVDQITQNIWAAGVFPILAPQDLPQGDTREERAAKLETLLRRVAETYKNKPVWIELCNEPTAFTTWEEWRPVAMRLSKAIRAVDAEAFIVCPLEEYGKDARAAAKSPLPSGLVDLYDGHAYIAPGEVDARFGEAARAGLPLLIGEYGSTDGPYLSQMNAAFQSLPQGVLAVSPWAFTVAGEDSIPLVANGDGKTIVFTAAGNAIVRFFTAWDKGLKIQSP